MKTEDPRASCASVTAGFGLIELLICVAVVAVLGGLALPGFQGAWRHARRTGAVEALLQMQLAEEQFHAGHGRYARDLPELNSAGAAAEPANYRLAAGSAGADQYLLAATATGAQTGDRIECQRLTINQRGERSPPEPSGCWR